MAAITTTLFAMLSHGAHVVVTDDSYRRTRQFLHQVLHRYGIEVSTVAGRRLRGPRGRAPANDAHHVERVTDQTPTTASSISSGSPRSAAVTG